MRTSWGRWLASDIDIGSNSCIRTKNGSMLGPGRKKGQTDGQWGQIEGKYVAQLIMLCLI